MKLTTRKLTILLLISSPLSTLAQNLESVSGSLFPAVEDHFAQNKAVHTFHLIEDKTSKTIEVKFPGGKVPKEIENLKPGSKVKIKGKKSNNLLEFNSLESSTSTSAPNSSLVYSSTALSGSKSLLAVRVNFVDANSVCSEAATFSTVFDETNSQSVKNFYQATSKGLLEFSGEIASVTIPVSISQTTTCDYNTWSNAANTVLSQAGYNLSSFQYKMYILPGSVPCGWAGLGNLNGGNSWLKSCSTHAMAHELGHNIGLGHASSETLEYGDGSDTMGNSGYREFNGAHKSKIGWVPSDKEITVNSSGTFRLSPTSEDPRIGSYPQVIKIFKPDTNEYYYLSYRTRIGSFDSALSTIYADKLNITRYKGTGSSNTLFLNALSDGQSFALPSTSIVVTNVSKNSSYLELSIASSTVCNEVSPSLSIGTLNYLAKQNSTLSGSLSLLNSSSLSCPNSTFDLSIISASSISGSVNPASLSLLPGATGNASYSLSTLSVPEGIYNLTVKAVNRANSSMQATKVIQVQIDNSAPSAPADLTASLKTKNSVLLTFSGSVDNIALSHYKILRNDILITTTNSTTYTNTGVGSGTYNYQVIAVDQAGNESVASNIATITIGKPGGGKPRR